MREIARSCFGGLLKQLFITAKTVKNAGFTRSQPLNLEKKIAYRPGKIKGSQKVFSRRINGFSFYSKSSLPPAFDKNFFQTPFRFLGRYAILFSRHFEKKEPDS